MRFKLQQFVLRRWDELDGAFAAIAARDATASPVRLSSQRHLRGAFAKDHRTGVGNGSKAKIRLIHGHGHNRGLSAGFVNTNTGYFGLSIRGEPRRRLRRLSNKMDRTAWIGLRPSVPADEDQKS